MNLTLVLMGGMVIGAGALASRTMEDLAAQQVQIVNSDMVALERVQDLGRLLAQTRAGKQVLTVRDGVKTALCRRVQGDSVAVVGDNRKVLVFPLAELPEMGKGKGVRLQKYKDGGLSDATTFPLTNGLSWKDPAGRTRTETELSEWQAARATAGRMAPRGFPRDNRFT